MKPLVLIGGGGHCRSCIDVIERSKVYKVVGVIDNTLTSSDLIYGYRILGADQEIPELLSAFDSVLITIGHIKNGQRRAELFEYLKSKNIHLPSIVSPSAIISSHANILAGTIVMHGTIVNASAFIGENCILNSQSLIEHDAAIGANCHISTGAKINGGVTVGDGTFIGSGAILREGIAIGRNCIVGAGVTVLKNIPDKTIYVG
jgi:sugar O-acyltransferase (sialic acid O-acetyltransferase NeuD family)